MNEDLQLEIRDRLERIQTLQGKIADELALVNRRMANLEESRKAEALP